MLKRRFSSIWISPKNVVSLYYEGRTMSVFPFFRPKCSKTTSKLVKTRSDVVKNTSDVVFSTSDILSNKANIGFSTSYFEIYTLHLRAKWKYFLFPHFNLKNVNNGIEKSSSNSAKNCTSRCELKAQFFAKKAAKHSDASYPKIRSSTPTLKSAHTPTPKSLHGKFSAVLTFLYQHFLQIL